jgi:hypothetical protein
VVKVRNYDTNISAMGYDATGYREEKCSLACPYGNGFQLI